jgi:hypothetical protein
MMTFCVTCKNKAETGDIAYVTTKNGRHMIKGKCKACGRVKCQFFKVAKEGGDLV